MLSRQCDTPDKLFIEGALIYVVHFSLDRLNLVELENQQQAIQAALQLAATLRLEAAAPLVAPLEAPLGPTEPPRLEEEEQLLVEVEGERMPQQAGAMTQQPAQGATRPQPMAPQPRGRRRRRPRRQRPSATQE